jgi:hypothetical protein
MTYIKKSAPFIAFIISLFIVAGCSSQQTIMKSYERDSYEWVKAGKFDTGKMWTFDFPPTKYFEEEYKFTPSNEWFEDARLAALRLPGCSASFVSEDGLVMTNHHCIRGSLDKVNKEGENLPENGFFAATLEEERKVPNLYVDQLILIEDVTADVKAAFESGTSDEEKVANRKSKISEIEKSYNEKTGLICNVITFFNGGRYSLYGYKRYTDVRLVFAPETQIGYYGGDYDNFTYPRYNIDVAFYRVYNEEGNPLKSENYFKWKNEGVNEGEIIFVIGNPGRTSRLNTVAQLEFNRDYAYPYTLTLLSNLVKVYSSFLANNPDKKLEYQSRLFGFSNSQKAYTGYLGGLRDPYLMAKKKDFEKTFKNAVFSKPDLKAKYGSTWDDIADIQADKSKIFYELNAYMLKGFGRSIYFSIAADLVEFAHQLQMPEDKRGPRYKGGALDTLKMKFYPKFESELENATLEFQLEQMKTAFSNKNNAFNKLIGGKSPKAAAADLLNQSILTSKESVEALLEKSPEEILNSTDPFVSFVVETQEKANELRKTYTALQRNEAAKVQPLGNAMYDIYGTTFPPDATFTLRIADGVVKSYEYNGTIAPVITTFYGMYDRYFSFKGKSDWDLPERWKNPPATFDLSTPVNFISTADIIGGNSGSPLINKNLEVVGLAFDGNMESLPGNFIFDDTKNRTIAVHTAGIIEAMEDIYNAQRIVDELLNGKIK